MQTYADSTQYPLGYAYTVGVGDVHADLEYPSGRVTTNTFDRRSRLESVFDGLGNGVQWTFDAGNRRESAALSNGAASMFAYDLNNRLLQIQHGNEVGAALDPFYDVAYGYDPLGNRLYKQDSEWEHRSEVYSYDQRHRLTAFRRGTVQVIDDVATFGEPINDPQMPSHQNWMPPGTTGLDSRGNWRDFTSTINGQTVTQTRTLDEAGGGGGCANEYERIDMPVGNQDHSVQQLTYDEAGNLVATDLLGDMNCDGAVNSDDRGPFKMAVNNPNGYALTYPDCMLELGDLNADGLVNTTDLDLFANVVSSTLLVARRYEYDEENRLTAVAEIDGNPLLEIEYDALGRRIASTEYGVAVDPCTGDAGPVTVQTRYIYSGLNAVAEYISCDGGDWGLAREVLWGDRFPEPLALFDFTAAGDVEAGTEEVLHYVHDALGSVVGLVDAGDPDATPEPVPPKLVERYDFDPYGKTYIETWEAIGSGGAGAWMRARTSAYGNPFTWTGQRYDASVGMYHFPFRSFSPELGRWMQRDPLGYVNGISLYAYVLGNPLYWTDPLGLKIWWQPGRGSTPDDMDKAQRQLADARTRRNPDGSMGRGAQDIERLNQDEEGGVVVVVGPNDGNVAMKISNRVAVISHDPNREETYDDGVKRDPESALVHEMRHSARGIYGPKPKSERESETDAGSVENEHRRNKGEEQRRKYGDWPLEQHDVMPPVVAAPNPWLPLLLQAYHDAWLAWWRWRNFVGPLTPSERQEADEAYDEARRLDDLVKKWAPEALKPVICW